MREINVNKILIWAAVVALCLVFGVAYYLKDQQGAKNTTTYLRVARFYQAHLDSIQGYTQKMTPGLYRDSVLLVLSRFLVLRTASQMDSINRARDSLRAILGDNTGQDNTKDSTSIIKDSMLIDSLKLKEDQLAAGGGGGGFEPEYQAVINEATAQGYTLPSALDQEIQNTIVSDLKTAGIWSQLDTFLWFRHASSDGFKNINWKNPAGAKGVLTDGATFNQYGLNLGGNASNNKYLPPQALVNHNASGSAVSIGSLTGNRGLGDVLLGSTQGLTQFLITASNASNSVVYWDVQLSRDLRGSNVVGVNMDGASVQVYKNGQTFGASSSAGINTAVNLNSSGTWFIGSTGTFELDGQISFFAAGGNYSQAAIYSAVASKVYEPEYQAILSEGSAQGYALPSLSVQNSQNQKIIDAKNLGIWDSSDAIYLFTGDGDRFFKMINWKNPTGDKMTEIGAGALIWDVNGVKGDNLNYLDSNLLLSSELFNYVQNNAGVYVDIVELSNGSNTGLYIGSVNATYNYAIDTVVMRPKINHEGTLGPIYTINSVGLYGASRNNSTQQIHSLEGVNTTLSANSGPLQAETLNFLKGVGTQRGTMKIGFIIIGANMSLIQSDIINTFR